MNTISARRSASGFLIALCMGVMLALSGLAAASFAPEQAYAKGSKVTVSVAGAQSGKVIVAKGSSYNLGAKASKGKLKYSSSNAKVATVTGKGVVKARSVGKATITVKSAKGKASKKVKVTVVAKSKYVNVKSIAAKAGQATIAPGSTTKIKVTFKPKKPSNANVKFTAVNKGVATVSAKGVVTAKQVGTAKVKVESCANPKAKKTVSIKVEAPAIAVTPTPVPTPVPAPAPKPTPTPTPSRPGTGVTTYTVTFDSRGGSDVESQTVQAGKTATEPEPPTRSGSLFQGWYTNLESSSPFDFNTPINSNLTLYALWSEDLTGDGSIDLGDLSRMMLAGTVDVVFGTNGVSPRSIQGAFTDAKVGNAEDAAEVLNSAGSLFAGPSSSSSFNAKAEEITVQATSGEGAERFYRYSPEVNGVPVEGSQIVLSTENDGTVTGLQSTYAAGVADVDTSYDSDEYGESYAKEQALKQAAVDCGLATEGNDSIDVSKLPLAAQAGKIVYAGGETSPILVWKVNVTNAEAGEAGDAGEGSTEAPAVDSSYYIDARNGNIVSSIDRISEHVAPASALAATDAALAGGALSDGQWSDATVTAKDLNDAERTLSVQRNSSDAYRMYDSSRKLSTHEVAFKDGSGEYKVPDYSKKEPVVYGSQGAIDKTAVSLLYNMTRVLDFYKEKVGLNSYDNRGAEVRIGFGDTTAGHGVNAYWSSSKQQFYYTKPDDSHVYAKALDVMGHEFTHAVIEYAVSDPGYTGLAQKSGLAYHNESGALNESYADIMGSIIEGKGKDEAGRWQIAEDSGSKIRDMSDRRLYSERVKKPDTKAGDWGGVHENSKIFNYAAYLMMTDSRLSSVTDAAWANLFYRSLYRLATDATFLDARCAITATANRMGMNHDQQEAMKEAFDKAGITEPDVIRITLTWGADPEDLDSHLVGPRLDGSGTFHTWYSVKSYTDSETGLFVVDLDWDDTDSYGPEVTTVHKLTPGDYYFFVHDYTTGNNAYSRAMAASNARVTVTYGDVSRSYSIDPSSAGTYWNVFKMNIAADGAITFPSYSIAKYGDRSITESFLPGDYDDDDDDEDYDED